MAAACSIATAEAGATVAAGHQEGFNGEGTFNDTLDCSQGGDGDNWRYFWLDGAASSPGGLLLGTWDSSFEVHRATATTAFIPDHDGRIGIDLPGGARGGSGFFDTVGGGSCANAPLSLTTQVDGDPEVSGQVPIVATGGTGAFRGLSGTGTATIQLELGPGADNHGVVDIVADLDVTDPALVVQPAASARWANFSAFLQKRLTVFVTVTNPAGVGNGYNVQIVQANGGTNWFEGIPAGNATIPSPGGATFAFTMRGANPNATYTINVKAAAKDGMLASVPPVTGSATFKAPLLP